VSRPVPDDALRARLDAATAALDPPLAVVDLAAFDANAADLERRAGGRPIRLASKSVRCRALIDRALARPGFRGILCFTLPEALWLAGLGHDDLLVAYPTADRAALRALATDPRAAAAITIMVDDAAQLDLAETADGGRAAAPVRVCLDLDASWRVLGGRVAIGAKRSPLHEPAEAQAFAREIVRRPAFRLVGVMAYEAQIAGVGDRPPGRPLLGAAVRWFQPRSAAELAQRRAAAVAAVRAVAPDLELVNGGGTGSLERTAAEDAITECAAGSGLYGPALFDGYGHFRPRPAALFALPVVRRPGRRVATVLGGGYLASGPGDRARLPQPFLPAGLALDPAEGAGEVQTPLRGRAAGALRVGDRVWFRHAKAGELCERFDALHLVDGDRITATAPTYRGEGRTFL
jgi:D-serine deaminase-like pyridoxal phosphate-dependent protein